MRNPTILDKSYFLGSASRRFETSKMMEELLKRRKIALALYDKTRQMEFHDAVMLAMEGESKLCADTLRVVLHGLYNGTSHITKGGIKDIALELLSENRDPSKDYFVKSATTSEPEAMLPPNKRQDFAVTNGNATADEQLVDSVASSETTVKKRTVFQRIFG